MRKSVVFGLILSALPAMTSAGEWDGMQVHLETQDGNQINIATLSGAPLQYSVSMNETAFSDHFLSMRPFKCVDGPEKTWCHVPYPYDIKRSATADLVDLEYDFLFVWKGKTEYGIDMWNGVYYKLQPDGDGYVGRMHEMDMDILAVPPDAGELRPVRDVHLEEADPDSHWLPVLRITR